MLVQSSIQLFMAQILRNRWNPQTVLISSDPTKQPSALPFHDGECASVGFYKTW